MKIRIQKEINRRAAARLRYEEGCHCVAQGTIDRSLAPVDDKQAIDFYEERCRCLNSQVEREGTLSEAHAHRELIVATVESLLRKTAPKTILFNCPGWTMSQSAGGDIPLKTFQCIDGLQRLTAVRKFMAGEIKIFGDLTPAML